MSSINRNKGMSPFALTLKLATTMVLCMPFTIAMVVLLKKDCGATGYSFTVYSVSFPVMLLVAEEFVVLVLLVFVVVLVELLAIVVFVPVVFVVVLFVVVFVVFVVFVVVLFAVVVLV